MSSENKGSSTASGGIGFTGALFLVFLVLKLCKVINWSWWWITAPLWGPVAIVIAFLIIYEVVSLIAGIADNKGRTKRLEESMSYLQRHLEIDAEKEEIDNQDKPNKTE